MDDLIIKTLEAVLSEYGVFALILIFVVVYQHRSLTSLWEKRLDDKDREIERLVAERDKLQELFLKKRLPAGGR